MKKLFSSFVAMMTIISSVGFGSLGFANVASAATAGDLLKASGPAVYYYAVDGKRYVFPNEKTYFSWYTGFSTVKTISDAELAAITIGGNVTVRPGTKLVKITTDPKTYAVSRCGTIHWVESEAIATQLYGSTWNTRIIDVPDAFFVNYTVGSSVSSAVHPNGQLVKYNGDADTYVVMDGQKRKFNPANALQLNGYNAADAVLTTISYPAGTDVAARESVLADTVCAGAAVGGEVTIKLASDTPAGITVPKNSASVKLAKFAVMGGSSDATINTLTIHRVGVGAAADFSNVYLYDASGKRLTTGRSINSTAHTATFSSLSISVPANGTVYVYVYGDFSSPSTTGGQHAIEILDAGSVAMSGSVTIAGTFPVRGNTFTVGTSLAARLDVTKGTTPANPNVGSQDTSISSFKLTANTNDVMVNQITLYQAGSVNNTDLTDVKLYQGTVVVGAGDAVTSDGRMVIKFSPSYLIKSGTTKIFTVKADIAGRASRTIKTYVEYTTDVNATDQVYNAGAAVCIADTAVGGCTTTAQGSFDGEDASSNYIEVTTQGGTLTRAFNGPATQNIAKGKLGVQLFKFALTAENAVEIRSLGFSIAVVTGSPAACMLRGTGTSTALDGTNYLRNIKLMNTDTGVTKMGPTELSSSLADTSDSSGTITLSDSFNLAAGETLNLAIAADLSNSEDNTGEFYGNDDCQYAVTLNAFGSTDVRIVETGEFLAVAKIVPNDAVTGNPQTVKSSNLTVTLASSPSSATVVKKQANLAVSAIVLTAGAQSPVTVTDITLECQAQLASNGVSFGDGANALKDCNERVSKLSLWNGDTMVGIAKAPDTTTGQAQITSMGLIVPAGSSLSLTIKADLSSTASTTSPYDQIAVGVADSGITAQDSDSNTVTPTIATAVDNQSDGASPSVIITVRNSGVVTYNTDANPASTIVVAGKDVWVPFARYKASAQYEPIKLDRIAVAASSTAGLTNTDNAVYSAVAVAVGGAVIGTATFSAGSTSTKDVDLTGHEITVPKDGSVVFELWAKITGIQSSSSASGATTGVHRSGMQPSLSVTDSLITGDWNASYYSSANIRSVGTASGELVYASSTNITDGVYMVTRKTKPVVTKQSLSSTTLANTDLDLLKFNVAADAAGSVAVKQIMFTVSKTSATTLANFRVRKGSSDMALADFAVNGVGTVGGSCAAAGTASYDFETGTIAAATTTCYIVVSFTNEEVVSGSGTTYTLHATVGGAVAGQNVSVSFYRDDSAPVVTGYLQTSTAHGSFPSSSAIFHIDTAASPATTVNATGTFLWSDNSEVPHSPADGLSAGSRDWTNDVFIEDISVTQSLSL